MATRNRTNIFMQHRNTVAKTHRAKPFEHQDVRASFMKNMPSDVERGLVQEHDASLPPAWIDVVDAVHDDVARITTKCMSNISPPCPLPPSRAPLSLFTLSPSLSPSLFSLFRLSLCLPFSLDSFPAFLHPSPSSYPTFYVHRHCFVPLFISLLVDELHKHHRQHLMPQFGEQDDLEQTIEIITQEITRLFRTAEQKIKKIQQAAEGQSLSTLGGDVNEPPAPAHKPSPGEDAVKKNVTRQLAMELATLSQSFRKSQQEYLARLRRQKEGLPNYDDKGSSAAGGSVAPVATLEEFDQGFTTQQLLSLEHSEAVIDERDRELRNIAASINDLAVIFKELSVLVIDQGTILDRIDYNVEQLVQHTEKGYQELKKAEDYQKSARLKLCIILLTVLVIGFGLALFFKKAIAKK
eukprot:TRINITY_DN2958_c1_g1_i2.p1 TRINITY_DN2958_c1_g1~~TRINITY_DN2958_c1_g1_i2.p1  ORF type:complete len:409 (+),score=59.55 TRINITY_DN2958_c1_g1_i2:206-1432(+)